MPRYYLADSMSVWDRGTSGFKTKKTGDVVTITAGGRAATSTLWNWYTVKKA